MKTFFEKLHPEYHWKLQVINKAEVINEVDMCLFALVFLPLVWFLLALLLFLPLSLLTSSPNPLLLLLLLIPPAAPDGNI